MLFGVRKAIHDLEITPQLISPPALLKLVKRSLGNSGKSPFAVNEDSIFAFAQLLVTRLDSERFVMEATYCIPLMNKANTYLLMKPIARGHFSTDGEAFLKPDLSSFALISFNTLEHIEAISANPHSHSLHRPSYANLEHCRRNVGSVRICSLQVHISPFSQSNQSSCVPQLKAVDQAPPGAKCSLPPTEECNWVAIPAPADFVESQLIAGAHLISTRLPYYSEIPAKGSLKTLPVQKPVHLYQIAPGSRLQFGKHRVYGTVYANTPIMALADVKFDLAGDRADQLARDKNLVLTAHLKTATKAFGKDVEVVVADSKPISTGSFWAFFMDSFHTAILLFTLSISVAILAALQFWSHCGRNVSLTTKLASLLEPNWEL